MYFFVFLFFIPFVALSAKEEIIFSRPPRSMAVYAVELSEGWEREKVDIAEDSRQPVARFVTQGAVMEVHTFPLQEGRGSIPPQANVERWTRQFSAIKPESYRVKPLSQNGFEGLKLEMEGVFKGREKRLVAVSFKVAPCFKSALARKIYFDPSPYFKEMEADVTLKCLMDPGVSSKVVEDVEEIFSSFLTIYPFP